jgi:hypothetical protein
MIAYSMTKVEYLSQTICGPTGRLQPVLERFALIIGVILSKIGNTVSEIIPLWPDLPEHIKALIKTNRV